MTMYLPPDSEDLAVEPRSIDLREYWLVVRRRWQLVVAGLVVGGLLAGAYAYTASPTYSATAQVLVTGITGGPANPSTQVSVPVNMSTEQSVAQGTGVLAAAAKILKVQQATLQVAAAKRLTVTVPATTLTTSNVLQISWKANSPQAARAGADAFATAFLQGWHVGLQAVITTLRSTLTSNQNSLARQIARVNTQLANTSSDAVRKNLEVSLNELSGLSNTGATQLEQLNTYNTSGGSIIEAALPTEPSGIGHSTILALGVLLGLLLGAVLAFVRDAFDDRIREPAQLERTLGVAVLATLRSADVVGADGKDNSRRDTAPVATVASPNSRAAEAARLLRATLVAVAARRNLRTFLVVAVDAGASPGRVVAELGVALAESGRRVLLVAADLRGSALPRIFDVPNKTGLSDLLLGGGDPQVLIRQPRQAGGAMLSSAVAQRLSVLSTGQPLEHTMSVIDSEAMISLLRSQSEAFEFVVLDSPPASVGADAFALAGHVDGVIVVAGSSVKGRAVKDLRRRLDQVGAFVVGGVFITKSQSGGHRRKPAPTPRPASMLPSAGPDRQGPPRMPAAATRPMPAIPRDVAPRRSSGPVKRPL